METTSHILVAVPGWALVRVDEPPELIEGDHSFRWVRLDPASGAAVRPARRKPAPGERACRHCGCTDLNACVLGGIPCHWVAPGLCSACQYIDAQGGAA